MISLLALTCFVTAPLAQETGPREFGPHEVETGATDVKVDRAPAARDIAPGVAPDGATVPPIRPRISLPSGTAPTALTDEQVRALGPISYDIAVRRDLMHFDLVEGTHWIRARAYKASADGTGFTYFPFLGSKASRNWPVTFRVDSATVGGQALALSAEAQVQRVGERYELDRGPVNVFYELALDQVEQVFRVETAGLNGDLILNLDLDTDLDMAPRGEGFRFSGPDGGMDLSGAFVLDADGGRTPIATVRRKGGLQLVVPATMVASLGGEVVIDPIVTSWGITSNPDDQIDIDAAYDNTTDTYSFVYEDPFSATDNDVFLTVVEINGTFVDEAAIDFTSSTWQDPEIANLNGDDVSLVVATRVLSGDDEIVGRIYDYSSLGVSTPQFVIANTNNGGSTTWTNANPDVGGNGSVAAGNSFLVCWERLFNSDSSILPRFTTVDAAGNVGSLGSVLLPFAPNARCDNVRVSESTGNPLSVNVWNLCWARGDTVTGEQQIFSAQLNSDGTLATSANLVLDLGTTGNPQNLDISDALNLGGLDPTYLISYDEFAPSDEDVVLLVCRNAERISTIDLEVREHTPFANQDVARLSTTAEDFVVCYSELTSGDWVYHVTTLDLVQSQLAISERRTILDPVNTGVLSDGPGMASRFSGGLLGSRFVGIGWDHLDSTDYDVAGVSFFASNPASPAWQYCYGVPNSTGDLGFLRLEGSQSISFDKTAVASGLPSGQFCLLVGATGFDDVPLAGGSTGTLCLGGSIGRYNSTITQADSSGVATFLIDPTALPGGSGTFSAMPGMQYQWQVWHRDLSGIGLPTSNFTNAVSITFDNPGGPSNDGCAGAIPLPANSSTAFDTTAATPSGPPWPCAFGGAADVWFSYRTIGIEDIEVSTCNIATYDTAIQIFTGDCANLVPLTCNDDDASCSSFTSIAEVSDVPAGTDLLIRVGGFNGEVGTGTVTLTSTPGSGAADECAGAVPLVEGVSRSFDTSTATTSAPAWPCASGGSDIWFTYTTAIASSDVTVETCGSSYDTAIQIFSGSCGSLTPRACNDNACGTQSRAVVSGLPSGTTLLIRVGGSNGATGSGTVLLTEAAPPPPTPSFASEIVPLFTSYSCTGCHQGTSPPAGLNLTGAASTVRSRLVGVASQLGGCSSPFPQVRVTAGNANQSTLYRLVSGNASCASLNSSMVMNSPSTDADLVRDWIDAGAPNN